MRTFGLLTISSSILLAACSGEDATRQAQYTITFPSIAAASEADFVQLLVFDASRTTDGGAAENDCANLILKRRGRQALGTAMLETTRVSQCDLFRGSGAAEIPKLSFGRRAFLAVVQRNNLDAGASAAEDFLLGCTIQDVTSDSPPVVIDVSLANATVAPPTSKCAALSQRCANQCQ